MRRFCSLYETNFAAEEGRRILEARFAVLGTSFMAAYVL